MIHKNREGIKFASSFLNEWSVRLWTFPPQGLQWAAPLDLHVQGGSGAQENSSAALKGTNAAFLSVSDKVLSIAGLQVP